MYTIHTHILTMRINCEKKTYFSRIIVPNQLLALHLTMLA